MKGTRTERPLCFPGIIFGSLLMIRIASFSKFLSSDFSTSIVRNTSVPLQSQNAYTPSLGFPSTVQFQDIGTVLLMCAKIIF